MKKIIKPLIAASLLAAIVITASVLYNDLSADYQGSNLITDSDLITAQLGQQTPTNGASPDNTLTAPEAPKNDNNIQEPTSEESKSPEEALSEEEQAPEPKPEDKPEEDEPPEPPKNLAPDFTVLDENGNAVKLSDFRGKPVVINFWATWCYYCRVEMPDFNEAYKKYPEIQFLMVNATSTSRETEEKARSFKSDNGYGFDIFFDTTGEATAAYNITGYPTTYFISAEGEIVASVRGMLKMATLERGIAMILPKKENE